MGSGKVGVGSEMGGVDMEQNGLAASRWEQVSKKTREMADDIEKELETIDKIMGDLAGVTEKLDYYEKNLEQLGAMADKEMLREESALLNDDEIIPEERLNHQ